GGGGRARGARAGAGEGCHRPHPGPLGAGPAPALRSPGGLMTGHITGHRSGAGFTLLEMTLVVLIIGLLATLVVPRVLGRTTAARQARATAELEIIAQALEGYRLDAGVYPTTAQGLDALRHAPVLPPAPPRWPPARHPPTVPREPSGHPSAHHCT